MAKKKKQNIDLEQDRYGAFMSDNSFDLEVMYGREYLKTDMPFVVKYYRIDIIKTKVDELYDESKPADKKFFPPVKLNVMLEIEDGETKFLSENGIPRNDTGHLKFGVFQKELDEKKVEVSRGDYVSFNYSGENERFYEIDEADNINDTTSKTIAGYKPFYRLITATQVKEDVLPFIRGI